MQEPAEDIVGQAMGDFDVSHLLDFPKLIDCLFTFHGALSQFHGSTTNELLTTPVTARISRMHPCGNHVSVSKGARVS
jgi:hypothetical protein